MVTLNLAELRNFCQQFNHRLPLRLQEVATSERDLVLEFYGRGEKCWLWIDLEPRAPVAFLLDRLPAGLPKRVKPLKLFLRANLLGADLKSVELAEDLGRVLRLHFDRGEIEIRLFPHGQNVLVQALDKAMSWAKPKELKAGEGDSPVKQARELSELRQKWLAARWTSQGAKGGGPTKESTEDKIKKLREKKLKAIGLLEAQAAQEAPIPWGEIGKWLVAEQSLEVPADWRHHVDLRRSLSHNIELCFKRQKEWQRKHEGLVRRLDLLRTELRQLDASPASAMASRPKEKTKELESNASSGVGQPLPSGAHFIYGRSAQENLQLLRAAKPWYFWVHLKDYPGSHAIIRRDKTQRVPDAELRQVGQALLKQSLRKKLAAAIGLKFELIVAECRHVRPIPGDRLGRVTYREERHLQLRLETD